MNSKQRSMWALAGLLVLVSISLSFAYVRTTTPQGNAIFWPKPQATLVGNLGCPQVQLAAWGRCWDDVARHAASAWNGAGSRFRFQTVRSTAREQLSCTTNQIDFRNVVVWSPSHCGRAWGDTVAITQTWFLESGEIADTDVLVNEQLLWNAYQGPARFNGGRIVYDLYRVLLHEFGHVLGLAHPDEHGQNVRAIMHSSNMNGTIERLQPDDIAGIKAIYGVAGAGPDPDYCVNNYCGIGDGDCDPGQCDEGVCVNDVGARYGLPAHYDVCEARGSGQPDPDYCVYNDCGAGEGDCDPGQCGAGLVCVNDVGARYGLPAHYDVCETRSAGRPDPDYCVYNYCGIGDGDCDPGQCDEGTCVNDVGAEYGLPAYYDVCETRSAGRPDPDYCVYNYCGIGDGDCDPGQCDEGVCVNDVGAQYGLPAHYDVCEAHDTTPPVTSGVRQFVGTWRFTNSRTTQTYRFGECPANTVLKPCVADVPQRTYLWPTYLFEGLGSLGHSYYLADVERSVCRIWLFYEPDGNRVSGHYGEAYGNCLSSSALSSITEDLTYQRYPTTGTRSSQSATGLTTTPETLQPPVTPEVQEALEQAIEDSLFLLMK